MSDRNKLYEMRYVFLSFVLAALIMIITYATLGMLDFGYDGKSILRVDLYHQYAPFHEEMRNKILNGESLFYSWEGGMGKEMLSQIAYYTASPISFLILLFPQEALPDAMALFILLKICFAAAFFAYYIKKSFNRNDITITAFSMFYAFCAFVTCYYWNLMWLDAVAVFPLIALGIEKIVNEEKFSLYCLSLAFTIIVNFYIAFIICIISVFYFAIKFFSVYNLKSDKKKMARVIGKFAAASLAAGGISMFLTIPVAIALSKTQASESTFPAFEIYENFMQLLGGHLFATKPVILGRNEDMPNIYSGILTIMLVPVYYFNKNIKIKEKILYSVLIVIMLLCSTIKPLDYLIHGMHFPSNLPHRFTFMYTFLLVTMGYKAFLNIKDFNFKYIYSAYVFYGIICIFVNYVIPALDKQYDPIMKSEAVAANFVIMAVYVAFLYFHKEGVKDRAAKKTGVKPTVAMALMLLALMEMCASSIIGLGTFGVSYRTEYNMYTADGDEAVKYLENNDEEKFFRSEFRRFTFINEAAYYHYKGFSIFSSLAYGDTSQLMQDMGMAATSNSYRYYDPTPLMDSILNIKYIMHKNKSYSKESAAKTGSPEYVNRPLSDTRYEKVKDFDTVSVYKNPQYLPLGFMVDSDIKAWKTADSMPFDVQNDFARKAVGFEGDIFKKLPLSEFSHQNINITRDEYNVSKSGDIEGADIGYELTYPKDINMKPSVEAKVYVPETGHIYAYVDAGNAKRFRYWINNDANDINKPDEDRELSTGRSLIDFGTVNAGTMITIRFELTNKGEFEKMYRKSGDIKLFAANFDEKTYQKVYSRLNDGEFYNISEVGGTTLSGDITAKKAGVMYTSIPFDKSWSVKVDGVEKELVPIGNGGFIGVDIPKGRHSVEFNYTPKGFFIGIAVSLVSLIFYIVLAIVTSEFKAKGGESGETGNTRTKKKKKEEPKKV